MCENGCVSYSLEIQGISVLGRMSVSVGVRSLEVYVIIRCRDWQIVCPFSLAHSIANLIGYCDWTE